MKSQTQAIRVLAVNDHDVARYTTTKMLRNAGFTVEEAADGRTALALARSKPDVIVLDVRLPDIDGYEVCRRIREDAETASIAVLHTSATFVSVERKVHGLEAGADAYLTQPFEPEELVAVVKALARLKRAEQDLRERTLRLEEADRRKDEFLAMLAHELRNPLAAITTSLPLLDRHPARDPVEKNAREVMTRQATHLRRLIDDLLDVSRVTHGKIELKRERLVLNDLVERCVNTSRKVMIEPREQRLEVNIPAEPLVVDGDPARLEQVFNNLLDNASKYSDLGASIAVQVEVVPCEGRSWVKLSVRDPGVGIAPVDLPFVFDLFSQAEQSIARSRGGLGIGLTLVKALVELHGGSVTARSEGLGSGAEFEIWLPLAIANAGASAPTNGRRNGSGLARTELDANLSSAAAAHAGPVEAETPRRIILVEDNLDSLEVLTALIEFWGHEVIPARDGLEGLRLILEMQPDLALVDIGLPELDGHEVARRVRADPRGQRMHLIALTGYGSPQEKKRALDSGFDHHLVKPVSGPELQAIICGAISPRRPEST